jgi:hypothetical protein
LIIDRTCAVCGKPCQGRRVLCGDPVCRSTQYRRAAHNARQRLAKAALAEQRRRDNDIRAGRWPASVRFDGKHMAETRDDSVLRRLPAPTYVPSRGWEG